MPSTDGPAPLAWFGGRLATGLVDVTDDLAALDSAGWWAVVVTFEGQRHLRPVRRRPRGSRCRPRLLARRTDVGLVVVDVAGRVRREGGP